VLAVSSASTGNVPNTSKSVIDLTDDDDSSSPASRVLPTQPQQVLLIAPQRLSSVPALTLPSSAAIVRSIRPGPPPPLHVAPGQRLQIPVCNEAAVLSYTH